MEKKELLLGVLVIFASGSVVISFHAKQSEGNRSTYTATHQGANCSRLWPNKAVVECDYKVGGALHFSIVGVGGVDPRVQFLQSDSGADYFATVSMVDGCVKVERGDQRKTLASFDAAYVSPRNGRVYRSSEECRTAGMVKVAGR